MVMTKPQSHINLNSWFNGSRVFALWTKRVWGALIRKNKRKEGTWEEDRKSWQRKLGETIQSFVDKKVCMLYPFTISKRKKKINKEKDTNFNGSDSKSTSFEKQTNTTRSNTFAKATNNSTSHQHVLHLFSLCLLIPRSLRWQTEQSRATFSNSRKWFLCSSFSFLVYLLAFAFKERAQTTQNLGFAAKICRVAKKQSLKKQEGK